MKNIFTKTFCLLLCFGSLVANAQTQQSLHIVDEKIETPVVETGTIRGHLITTDNKPAADVNVTIKGMNRYAVTDVNGDFVFKNVKTGNHVLSISMVGLQPMEKELTVITGQTLELRYTLYETSKQLQEVIVSSARNSNLRPVTIDKSGIAPIDLPQSTGVVSSKVITDQQANRLGDIVKNVSGVSLTQQRQGVAETFSARGYSIGIAGAGGSIFKNGIISNTMGFPEASALESVEVLKGSSALLYGNTSGGVIINMVTKKPKFNYGGEVSMRVGSYDLYKPVVDIYGPISKNLAFRVIGTYESANSYRDVVKSKRSYVNPSLLYKLGKKTTLLLQGDYLYSDFTPDNGIGILNQNMNAVIPASRSRFINFSWAYYKLQQTTASVTVDYKFSDNWKANFIAATQGTNVDAYGSNVPNAITATGDFSRSLSRTKTTEKDYTLQLNFTGNFNTAFFKHQLLIGADAVRVITGTNAFKFLSNGVEVSSAYDKINILDPTKSATRTDIPEARDTLLTTSPSNRLGFYIQDLISITEKVKVLAGVRWSYLKTFNTNTFNKTTQTESKGGSEAENKAFSPKVALIYQPVKTTSIYTSYSNNFATNSPAIDVYGSQIEPSITDQYEVGIKNELLKGKLSANISVYKIVNHNFYAQAAFLADDTTANNNSNIKELAGETTSDGFEIDVNGTISKNFYFMAGYGYNYMRYTKTTGAKYSPLTSERLINNPENTFNGTLFYTFDCTPLKGLKLGASAFYTGKRFGGVQNTVGQTNYNRLVPLSDFTTIDLSAGYNFKKVSLQAKISNIANTFNYLAHDRYSINPISPRQVAATVAYRF